MGRRSIYSKVKQWKRPTDLEKSPSLWGRKGAIPDGVKQGSLNDCWVLATGAALAEKPERLMKIFSNIKDYPANGAFKLNFYAMGRPISVVVDDYLPMDPRHPKRPVNSK